MAADLAVGVGCLDLPDCMVLEEEVEDMVGCLAVWEEVWVGLQACMALVEEEEEVCMVVEAWRIC